MHPLKSHSFFDINIWILLERSSMLLVFSIGTIPEFTQALEKLEVLAISNTFLTGKIPDMICSSTNLRSLSIGNL
jgi:hypothetical protein